MRGFVVGLSVSGAFVVGCVAAQFIVPPARAAGVQKWDYFCFDEEGAAEVTRKAKQAGTEGWEMVAVDTGGNMDSTWCFKRPAQ